MSNSNKRSHIRTKLSASVKLTHPKVGEFSLYTGDISDGGAYVLAQNTPPMLGEVVSLQMQGIGGDEAPILKMRVVRADKEGIGLEFIDEE